MSTGDVAVVVILAGLALLLWTGIRLCRRVLSGPTRRGLRRLEWLATCRLGRHSWDWRRHPEDCTERQVCSRCLVNGPKDREAHSYQWVYASDGGCEQIQKCRCGRIETSGARTRHVMGDATVSVSDTHHQRICQRDKVYAETEPHCYEWTYPSEESCEQSHACSCGRLESGERRTRHLMGPWVSVSDTQHQRTCQRDGAHTEIEAHVWREKVTYDFEREPGGGPNIDPGTGFCADRWTYYRSTARSCLGCETAGDSSRLQISETEYREGSPLPQGFLR